MLLQLIPPSGCVIPASLRTHAVPTPPSFPRGLKQPANWTRTRTTLNAHGITLPTHQCIDRASWLSLAVEQVTWNLEDDVLVVAFVDGSVERWPIAASPLSTQASLQLSSVRDTREDNAEQAEQIQDISNYERAAATLLVPANESSKSRDSCSAPLSSLSSSSRESWCLPFPPSSSNIKTTCPLTDPSTTQPLRNLCSQLGTAYEKFVRSGTHHVADDDLEHIVTMAGDATVAPLPQWEPDASIGVPSGSMSGSSPPRSDDDRDGKPALSHPTEPTAVMPFPGIFPPRSAPTLEEVRPSEHQREHLRSAWGEAVRKVKESRVPEAEGAVGVHVPLLSILKTIRITMLDLFSRVLAPAIKKRLDAPTYCVWATSKAAKAARARAVVRAGEVAGNILALLNDDGQTFGAGSGVTSESESESDHHEDPGGVKSINQLAEEEWRGVEDFGASTAFELGRRKRRTALKERRIYGQLSNNVMRECFDDFELRLWCEQTIDRAQMMEDSRHTSEECGKPGPRVPHPHVSATSVGPWTWARSISSGDITRFIMSDSDIPKVTIKRRSVLLGPNGSGVTSKNEPDETGEDPSTSPPATDLSDSEGQDCSPKRRAPVPPAVIALEDPLGEELLPPRIPRALVTNARDPYLGYRMIAMRRRTHQSLDQVAGVSVLRPHSESGVSELTRRIPTQLTRNAKDLRDYLARQLIDWDKQQVKEKALKPPQVHQKSCLRYPTTSDSPTVESKRVGSSKAQPLIQRAADRSVSRHVRNELERRRRSGSISKKAEASITKHRNTPRKRQRENLDIIDMIENAKSPARKLPKQATNTPSLDKATDENFGSQQTSTMSQDSEPNILDRPQSPWSNLPSFPCAATTGTSAQLNRPPRSHFTSVDDNRESGATSTATSSTALEDSVAPAERFSIQEFHRFRPHPVEHVAATDLTLENKSSIEDVPTVRRNPHSWDRKYPYGEDGDEEMRLLGDGEDDSEEEVVDLGLTRLSDVDDESEPVDTGSQTQGKRHTPSGISRVSQGLAEQGSISSQWVPPRPRSSWRTGATPRSTPRDVGNPGPEVLEQRKAAGHCGVTSDDLTSSEFSKETSPRPQEDDESSDIEVEVESPEAPAWIHSLRAPLVDITWRSERSVPPSAEEMGTSAVISGTR